MYISMLFITIASWFLEIINIRLIYCWRKMSRCFRVLLKCYLARFESENIKCYYTENLSMEVKKSVTIWLLTLQSHCLALIISRHLQIAINHRKTTSRHNYSSEWSVKTPFICWISADVFCWFNEWNIQHTGFVAQIKLTEEMLKRHVFPINIRTFFKLSKLGSLTTLPCVKGVLRIM